MRARLVSSMAAVLLASAAVAGAQTPPTKPEPAAGPSLGVVDVGYRGGATDGDEARFERYRDLRPGVATWFALGFSAANFATRRPTNSWRSAPAPTRPRSSARSRWRPMTGALLFVDLSRIELVSR